MAGLNEQQLRELWRAYGALGIQLKALSCGPMTRAGDVFAGDDAPLDALNLETRTRHCLVDNDYFYNKWTVGEVAAVSDRDLLKMKNFGRVSLADLRGAIMAHRVVTQ